MIVYRGILILTIGWLFTLWGCPGETAAPEDVSVTDTPSGEFDTPVADTSSSEDTAAPAEDVSYPSLTVDEAVALYDEDTYSTTQLLGALEQNMNAPPPENWEGTQATSIYFPAGFYEITEDLTIAPNATFVLNGGVSWKIHAGVTVRVEGRILALGREDDSIHIHGIEDALFSKIIASGGPNVFEHVVFSYGETLLRLQGIEDQYIEKTRFDAWSMLALDLISAHKVTVTQCQFAINTPEGFVLGEAIHGVDSPVRIEGSTFGFISGYRDAVDLGDCALPDIPLLIGNHFMGGEDDAIDLDDCTAIVSGNRIENYRPNDLELEGQSMNGGGITGSGNAQPLLANNVIRNCYHGIGFKDGAQPLLIHNTITDCHIGVTLYQSSPGKNAPHGALFNNILWNNRNWFDDADQDLLLHGRWWPSYNQEAGDQATATAQFNLTTEDLEGENNQAADPLLLWESGFPVPKSDSPAIDTAGKTNMPTGVFTPEEVWSFLELDCLGQPRTQVEGIFDAPDRGAVEVQP